ncbi:hypothetical protein SBA2_320003 [Acidobacteriia bacterium SbA2]|nr:hypothetical protein SBA2_320003 [Acidobacteriia bacterium SbA2]
MRGYFGRIQTPVQFSRLSRQAIQIQRVGPGVPNSASEFGFNAIKHQANFRRDYLINTSEQ